MRGLSAVAALVLLVSVAAGLHGVHAGGPALRLEPGAEASPLTWLGSSLLLGIALLCVALGARARSLGHAAASRWWAPALVATVMSADEVVAGHEALGDALLLAIAAPVGLALAVILWPLWRAQPARERQLWLWAASLYGLGVVAVDALPRLLLTGHRLSAERVLLHGVEEGLELAGLLVLLTALLRAAVQPPDA